jgi:hypothetical protein
MLELLEVGWQYQGHKQPIGRAVRLNKKMQLTWAMLSFF